MLNIDQFQKLVVKKSNFLQRIGNNAQQMIFSELKVMRVAPGKKLRFKEGVLIDLFIIIEGTLDIITKRRWVTDEEEEQEQINPKLMEYDMICWDNIWQYIEDYGKYTRVRYLHNIVEQGNKQKVMVLTMPMPKYKQIVKKTHKEMDLVNFICTLTLLNI